MESHVLTVCVILWLKVNQLCLCNAQHNFKRSAIKKNHLACLIIRLDIVLCFFLVISVFR